MTSDQAALPRKKLLVLTSTFPRWEGDDEPPFVFELSKRLVADFEVCVLAPHAPGAKTHETLDGLKVRRFRYFAQRWESLAYQGGIMVKLRGNRLRYLLVAPFLLCQMIALLRLMNREKFDIVQAHWLIPQGLLAVLARKFSRHKPAILCTSHGSDITALRGKLFGALQRYTLRHAEAVSTVSHAMRQRIIGLGTPPEKISVISMGVDARQLFTPDDAIPRSSHEILCAGRLVPGKGVELLLRALPAILAGAPQATLTVAGYGPMEGSLRQLCDTLGVADKVRFAGAVHNASLPDFFRRAALCVLPSQAEGFGLVCAEAMACACPVLVSDLPALRELVDGRETGLMFPVGDVQALAGRVLDLLADEKLRRRLGQAGREKILKHHDWQAVAQRYRDLLLETADQRQATAARHGRA